MRRLQRVLLILGLGLGLSPVLAETRFETPEAVLAHYINSLNARDLAGVNATFLQPVPNFSFAAASPVERYRVVKKTPHTAQRAQEEQRLRIKTLVVAGDLELHVEEMLNNKAYMFSYFFRQTAHGWKIVEFAMWDTK